MRNIASSCSLSFYGEQQFPDTMKEEIVIIVLLLLLLALVNGKSDHVAKTHIAIVGAGIGGVSTAYWLKHYLNDSVAITIYESNQVGGRLATVKINGTDYEAGGSIIHEKNMYMKQFVKELDLKQIDEPSSLTYLITNDGTQTLFSTLSRYIPEIFLVLWRYGFDAFRLKYWLNQALPHFLRIYDYQENGRTFETVDEFLQMLDKEFYASTRMSFRKLLIGKGFQKRFIDEIAQMAALVNYDQSVDRMHGFPGLVSLMAVGSKLWHVSGGNHLVPKQLLERLLTQPDVQFVRGHVKNIEEVHRVDIEDQGGNVRLFYQPKDSQLVHGVDYDYIIVAFPLHRDNLDQFVLQPTDKFDQHAFRMQSTHANFLTGQLDCQHLNLSSNECSRLQAIFYTNPSLPYRCAAQQQPVDQNERTESVYKVFSPNKLSTSDYEQIFKRNKFEFFHDIPWLAYPKYNHPQQMPPIQLSDHVFYVNAMEWSASCMEIETISARNVAMLLTKRLGVELKRPDKHVEF